MPCRGDSCSQIMSTRYAAASIVWNTRPSGKRPLLFFSDPKGGNKEGRKKKNERKAEDEEDAGKESKGMEKEGTEKKGVKRR